MERVPAFRSPNPDPISQSRSDLPIQIRSRSVGLRQLKAVKSMSNDRCVSHYLPLIAYVAPRQMARRGDLWPYSTRAVEARGGRYKRISRKVAHRKRSALDIKAVQNLRLGTVSFKKTSYNSSRTLQMSRVGSHACRRNRRTDRMDVRAYRPPDARPLAATSRSGKLPSCHRWGSFSPPMRSLLCLSALPAFSAHRLLDFLPRRFFLLPPLPPPPQLCKLWSVNLCTFPYRIGA